MDALPGDGAVMRGLFYLMLAAIFLGLVYDYNELAQVQRDSEVFTPSRSQPVLPPHVPAAPGANPADLPPAPRVTTDADSLRKALTVELRSAGVLAVTGTIDPGSAARFSAEVGKVGEYVKAVVLNSPGGSVRDALSISELVRERGFQTRVESGALCASSCPLVFAGGKTRIAGSDAAIGVHQVFSGNREGPRNADIEISSTQRLTADINRHLEAMGVDQAVWLHALDTPPDRLYYFSPDELKAYRLATEISGNDN